MGFYQYKGKVSEYWRVETPNDLPAGTIVELVFSGDRKSTKGGISMDLIIDGKKSDFHDPGCKTSYDVDKSKPIYPVVECYGSTVRAKLVHLPPWTLENHMKYRKEFRDIVFTLLLCQRRESCILSSLPKDVIFEIISWLPT